MSTSPKRNSPGKLEKFREDIIARYEAGESVRNIAQDLNYPDGTVRDSLKRWGVFQPDPKNSQAQNKSITDPKGDGIDVKEASKRRRFVITSALNDCEIHDGFFRAIKTYCEVNDAQLLVIPVRYKNVSLYTGAYEPHWPHALDPYWIKNDLELSSNVTIMGSMRIQATAARPLRGTHGISKGKSAVFGHPRVALETVATPLAKYPMVYLTTGTISIPAYSETKAGRLGEFHHSISAAIVETDGEKFWWRHIHANDDGSFIDIDTRYTSRGAFVAEQAEAVIVGDIHVGFHDESVTEAILQDLVSQTGAKNVILHDVLDMFSGSHHHANNNVLKVMKAARGRDSVYGELERVAEFFDRQMRPGVAYYVIRSNHHDHLERWLNNNSAHIDAKNLWLWHHLNAAQMKEAIDLAENDPEGHDWNVTSAFELAIRALISEGANDQLEFHDDRHPLEFKGIDVSNHGDRGPNGVRGTRSAFAAVQRQTFIGHSHAPGITDGCYQVGMSCRPDMPYMSGYSGWLATSGIIYSDGNRTLLPVIGGRFRMEDPV